MLLTGFAYVVAVRTALGVFPFARARSVAARMGRRSPRAHAALSNGLIENRAWAIRSAASIVPGAACLTQAMALQAWLSRSATPSELRIGVAQGDGGFAAHAWLEVEGQAVIGGSEIERYTRLPELEPRAS